MKKILIISGLDPSGNAGLLRDLEVVSLFPLKPSAIVTALTAQNEKKFLKPQVVSPRVFKNQIGCLSPLSRYQAVKIGMLGNALLVGELIHFLEREKKRPPVVLDPVLKSTTGGSLLNNAGKNKLWDKLVPLVSLWTPNIYEASFFSGLPIRSLKEMALAGDLLFKKKKTPLLLKGGHLKGRPSDLYIHSRGKTWFRSPRIKINNQRGSGCALSSFISSYLAEGLSLDESVACGKRAFDLWFKGKSSGFLP